MKKVLLSSEREIMAEAGKRKEEVEDQESV